MPHVQIARKTWATCPPRSQGRCHNFGIIKTCQKMDCIAQIVNSSKLCVNFSHRIRMDSIQSQCSAIWTLFKSHVIKLFLIFLWTQISNFGHFGHFDFGHKSTQNPGAMPQLWHLTLATCPLICGTIINSAFVQTGRGFVPPFRTTKISGFGASLLWTADCTESL